ncbi:hypothetical protein BKA70DRAFT_1218493 [Coprinopsis sp. MPI-PUGE-AT-0042]|nr:hypothetical protein BKA70DRAFT_1218493 [Coprinopsis sp. MPI-PUGE-AT-0042]
MAKYRLYKNRMAGRKAWKVEGGWEKDGGKDGRRKAGTFQVDLVTDLQALEVTRKREQLQLDINAFLEGAERLFPGVDLSGYRCFRPPVTNPEIENDDGDDELVDDEENPFTEPEKQPEEAEIPLPSSFDTLPNSLKSARRKEIKLRIAQANDTLEAIRSEIGHKSYLYRSNIRLAEGKKQKTRGYDAVKSADNVMRHNIRLYSQATWALERLQAPTDVIARFKKIEREDTKAITTVYKPNLRGQSNIQLSWIWTMDVQGDSQDSVYLEELYRVNWLKAKSMADRCSEEYTLLRCEMDWVCQFFIYKEEECKKWALLRPSEPGHVAYAYRQAETWSLLRGEATSSFNSARDRGVEIQRDLERKEGSE